MNSKKTKLQVMYEAWAKAPIGGPLEERQKLWDDYCDARDGVPEGSSNEFRVGRDHRESIKIQARIQCMGKKAPIEDELNQGFE